MSIINAAIKDNPRKEDDDGEILVEKEKKECEICLKLLPAQSFRQEVKDIDCHHTTYICTTCLKDAIKMNVEIYSWSAIPCPFDDCENILDPSFLKKFLSGRLLEHYTKFVDTLEIRNLPNFRWCLNPNGCGAGQVYDHATDNPQVKCQKCEFEICFVCQLPWHEEKTCAENKSTRGISKSAELIQKTSKLCPSCEVSTFVDEEDIVCGHLICACGQHWDWNDVKYREG